MACSKKLGQHTLWLFNQTGTAASIMSSATSDPALSCDGFSSCLRVEGRLKLEPIFNKSNIHSAVPDYRVL